MARRPKPWYRKSVKRWYVQIDGKKICLGPDKESAILVFHQLMAHGEKSTTPVCVGIADLFERFLEWTAKNRAKRTYIFYQERLQRFLMYKDHISLTAISIKPYHVSMWLDAHGWSNGYKRGCVISLKRAFNWSVKQGLIDSNPIHAVEKPPESHREQTVSEEHYQIMLESAGQKFADLIRFLWETGCRPEEVVKIEPRHVNLEEGIVTFPACESKGRRRQRIILLSDTAIETVERNHNNCPIFLNARGRPWTSSAMSCQFHRFKSKLEVKYRAYDFRHTFCTRGLKAGVDAVTMANLMGHTSTIMISRVYGHLLQDPQHLRKSLNF